MTLESRLYAVQSLILFAFAFALSGCPGPPPIREPVVIESAQSGTTVPLTITIDAAKPEDTLIFTQLSRGTTIVVNLHRDDDKKSAQKVSEVFSLSSVTPALLPHARLELDGNRLHGAVGGEELDVNLERAPHYSLRDLSTLKDWANEYGFELELAGPVREPGAM